VLTSALDWHWVFLVNIPIGIAVIAWSLRLLPGGSGHAAGGKLDVAGAVTVTVA
jgi:predicted MFS family arabinose efflux permease